jgi:hypothetical protein
MDNHHGFSINCPPWAFTQEASKASEGLSFFVVGDKCSQLASAQRKIFIFKRHAPDTILKGNLQPFNK